MQISDDLNRAARFLQGNPDDLNARRAVSLELSRCQFAWDGVVESDLLGPKETSAIHAARDAAFASLRGKPEIVAIVAATEDLGIGLEGGMPWDHRLDLKRFRRLTEDHTVIMGRKTYTSIGRPLPRRRNIVLTRSSREIDGVITAVSAAEAIAVAAAAGASQVFIIGGSEIYGLFRDYTERLERTLIPGTPTCDTFFPYPPAAFGEKAVLRHADDLVFESWVRGGF